MQATREYDHTNPKSIENYSKQLIGKTFAQVLAEDLFSEEFDKDTIDLLTKAKNQYLKEKNKGGLGQLIEKYYFHYLPNSSSDPDFKEAGVELKVSPYRINKNDSYSAKERLILTMIDYMTVIDESFYESHLWKKIHRILLIYYLFQEGIERLDYQIDYAQLFTPPTKYLPTIINDYKIILDKIKAGKAHELSGSDTDYLEAATKSTDSSIRRPQPNSPIPAKPRAFAFKNAFMTQILNEYIIPAKSMFDEHSENSIFDKLDDLERKLPLEECVTQRISKYVGYTESELVKEFNLDGHSKNQLSRLVFKILGVPSNKVTEFEMAHIVVKTIRIEKNGNIKESMSFPAFKFKELVEETWDTSVFGNHLRDTRFFFVVYRMNKSGEYVLKGCQFWNIPYADLEQEVHSVWQKTQDVLREGLKIEQIGDITKNNLPKGADNPVCHVRPHGRDKNDTDELPDGRQFTKQCFWLKRSYVKSQLKKEFFD